MSKHVVVGSGPVGSATAVLAAEQGHEVVLVSRSGTGPELPGVRRVALDVTDVDGLTALCEGAAVLYNCVNPPSYDVWPTWWPPVAEAFLTAAERSGAVLATASCLYAYGEVDGPMVEGQADSSTGVKGRLRADMWANAHQAHQAGRARVVEVRGSDYMGPGVTNAHIPTVVPAALKGKTVRVFGATDVPHSITDVRDMARTLLAAATSPEALGRVWHAPSTTVTQGQALADVCASVGRPAPRVKVWPKAMLTVGGLFMPFLREMRETVHQFEHPYVLDCSAAERELGLAPTPWLDTCRATAGVADPALVTA